MVDSKEGENNQEGLEALDFSSETTNETILKAIELGNVYNPRPQEDAARRRIAYSLIALLWTIVVLIFVLIIFKRLGIQEIKEFGVIISPIVTLVSAATGFYYGTKSN